MNEDVAYRKIQSYTNNFFHLDKVKISYINVCEDTIFGWYKKDYTLMIGVNCLAILRNMSRI